MLLGLVLEDQSFEHAGGELLVFFVELLDRFELQLDGFVGAAFGGVEDQFISTDRQRNGEITDDLQVGLGLAGFIALDLRECGRRPARRALLTSSHEPCAARSAALGNPFSGSRWNERHSLW